MYEMVISSFVIAIASIMILIIAFTMWGRRHLEDRAKNKEAIWQFIIERYANKRAISFPGSFLVGKDSLMKDLSKEFQRMGKEEMEIILGQLIADGDLEVFIKVSELSIYDHRV